MAIDLKVLNHNQLNELITKAQQRQQELNKERIVKLRERVRAMVVAEGYALEEVFGHPRKGARATGKVPPKYRNPLDPKQTWSGRGKRPRWFLEALRTGKKEKELAI